MTTRIQKWGNSQGLRITRQILYDARLAVGDNVEVTARDGVIIISPVKRLRGKYDLQELLSRIPPNFRAEETDWGKPEGKEVW